MIPNILENFLWGEGVVLKRNTECVRKLISANNHELLVVVREILKNNSF